MTVQCTNCLKMVEAAADGRLPPWCPWCGAELRAGSKSLPPQSPAKPVEAPAAQTQPTTNGAPPPKPALPPVPAEVHSPAELRATADAFVRGQRLDWLEPLAFRRALEPAPARRWPRTIAAVLLLAGAFWGLFFVFEQLLGNEVSATWLNVGVALGIGLFAGLGLPFFFTLAPGRVIISADGIWLRLTGATRTTWGVPWGQVARLVYDDAYPAGGRNWNVLQVVSRAGEERVIGVGHKVTRQQLAELVEAYGVFHGVRLEGTLKIAKGK